MIYSRISSKKMTSANFNRAYPGGSQPVTTTSLWFLINRQSQIVVRVRGDGDGFALPNGATPWEGYSPNGTTVHLGDLNGVACRADWLDDDVALPSAHRALGLRDLFGRIDDDHYGIAGYATQMISWQLTANFCPICATPLENMNGDWGKKCPRDGHTMYPPVSPCTITLIHDGDRILMTHKAGWGPRYGLVAGFVEPGETLEENVAREIKEETGVDVTDITYWRSQPWPFPHQIMCGFYARYVRGDIKIDTNELDDARWFTVADIRSGTPTIPAPLSIARQLIDNWLVQNG
jgi:NAD+ diphosphatase